MTLPATPHSKRKHFPREYSSSNEERAVKSDIYQILLDLFSPSISHTHYLKQKIKLVVTFGRLYSVFAEHYFFLTGSQIRRYLQV